MMQRFAQTIAVLCGGLVLASGVQAGVFWKSPPPAAPVQAVPGPVVQTAPPPLATQVVSQPAGSLPVPSAQVPSTPVAPPKNLPAEANLSVEMPSASVGTPEQPRTCMVNTKQVLLSYEFKDVGPSGVAGVEVWYTRDGKGWQKFEGVQRESPVWIELEEGTFGIYLLARTGYGGGREAPGEGDQPQIWIQVDLTKPVVFLTGVHQSNGTHTLDLKWTARDDNFGRKPISLYYAEQTAGPWIPIATGLENTGAYTWQVPPSAPANFYVRVEAVDRAGNVEGSTTQAPVKIDLSQPNVTNIQLKPVPSK